MQSVVFSHGTYTTSAYSLYWEKACLLRMMDWFPFFKEIEYQWLTSLEVLVRVEAESLLHLSAKYCPLLPPPRSTIAAAFSPDGKVLASTQ